MTHHGQGPAGPGGIPNGIPTGQDHGQDRWILVGVAGLLAFVAMLDMNIVNVALAAISGDLRVPAATVQWVVLGYQLPVVALLLPVGRWLDGSGRRPAVLVAITGFALCSALAAAAPWAGLLIAARVAQGVFGAVLFVLMPVLAMGSVRPALRGRAMSVPATLGPLGAVTGPAVGGLLLDAMGWRAVFLVKIPFCVLALVVAWKAMPGDGARLRLPRPRALLDASLAAAGVTVLLVALTLAAGHTAWLALAVAAVPPLWLWLRGQGGKPVAGVLRVPGLASAHGAVLALATGFAAVHYVIAFHLQRDDGVSATATGLTVLAFPLGMGIAGPLGGRLADRYGARPVAVSGAVVTATGLFLLVPLDGGWSPGDVAWRLALAGAGMGLNGGPTQALVMSAAPPERAATTGSTVQLARSLGFTLGPVLATAVWGLAGAAQGARAGLVLAAIAAAFSIPLLALPASSRTTGAPATAADAPTPAPR
ncbi:MFS transporter [Streptomyces sp. NPDC059828]|uniref:MFS transporter n=1 Tax=Streptomyces sp. NPDC059828 TaxID=3346965 RepID=UPI00365C579D